MKFQRIGTLAADQARVVVLVRRALARQPEPREFPEKQGGTMGKRRNERSLNTHAGLQCPAQSVSSRSIVSSSVGCEAGRLFKKKEKGWFYPVSMILWSGYVSDEVSLRVSLSLSLGRGAGVWCRRTRS